MPTLNDFVIALSLVSFIGLGSGCAEQKGRKKDDTKDGKDKKKADAKDKKKAGSTAGAKGTADKAGSKE